MNFPLLDPLDELATAPSGRCFIPTACAVCRVRGIT